MKTYSAIREFVRIISTAAGGGAALSALAHAQTLQESLIAAYETSPVIKAERAALRIRDEGEAQAWSLVRPQLNATGSYQFTQLERDSPFETLNNNQTEQTLGSVYAGFTATQPLFQGLRNVNAIRRARADTRAARAQLVGVEQDVLVRTVEAYLDVRTELAVLDLARNTASVLETELDAANARLRLEAATRTDVAQAQARLARARADVISARARLEIARAAYLEATGLAAESPAQPTPLLSLPQTEQEAQALAAEHAPTAVQAAALEEASRRQVAVARGDLAPKIVAEAGYSFAQDQTFEGDQTEQTFVGVRATVPLYDGGAGHARVREAKQTLARDRYLAAQTLREVQTAVRRAWVSHEAANAAAVAARRQVEANEIAAEGVRKERSVGRRTTLDVLNAEQELLDSRVELLRAERDSYLAGVRVLAAIGQFTIEAMGLDAPLYDAKRNSKGLFKGAIGFGVREDRAKTDSSPALDPLRPATDDEP